MDKKLWGILIVAFGIYLAWVQPDIGGWFREAFRLPGY